MTKQDILDAISASPKVQRVHTEILKAVSSTVNLYDFHCLIGNETTVNDEVISFYVYDEGGANEAAYWRPNALQTITPKSTVVYDAAKAFMDGNLGQTAGGFTLISYSNLDVNEELKTATVDVSGFTTSGAEDRKYLLWRDNGNIELKVYS